MRKTFSVLDEYGGVLKQFEGTSIRLAHPNHTVFEVWDYVSRNQLVTEIKAYHNLAPGHTICHTEEKLG